MWRVEKGVEHSIIFHLNLHLLSFLRRQEEHLWQRMECSEWSILSFWFYPPFLMGERVSTMREGWDTGSIGGGRIKLLDGKEHWQKLVDGDGMSEKRKGWGQWRGWSIQRVGCEGLSNNMRENECMSAWSIYGWRRREHSSSTCRDSRYSLGRFASLVCLQHMPSHLSQHSSFITARTEGLFNPVKDISVATVNEARRLAWYQGFLYEPG